MADTKLYDLLGVPKTASDADIKKVSHIESPCHVIVTVSLTTNFDLLHHTNLTGLPETSKRIAS
jgi:hypothetical protein